VLARLIRRPLGWAVLAALAAGVVFGSYWFQPWKLVTDQAVSETLSSPDPVEPVAAPATSATPAGATPASTAPAASAAPARPVVVREGEFITHEHDTSGSARIVRAADGSHTLELVGLDTSNGPDLRVWLSDREVVEGLAGWRVFDDGEWVELGRLKGNRGDQAYRIPATVDPAAFRSVSIWCKRFAVSFGAAELASP
jgi:hypothetical protein